MRLSHLATAFKKSKALGKLQTYPTTPISALRAGRGNEEFWGIRCGKTTRIEYPKPRGKAIDFVKAALTDTPYPNKEASDFVKTVA